MHSAAHTFCILPSLCDLPRLAAIRRALSRVADLGNRRLQPLGHPSDPTSRPRERGSMQLHTRGAAYIGLAPEFASAGPSAQTTPA